VLRGGGIPVKEPKSAMCKVKQIRLHAKYGVTVIFMGVSEHQINESP